MDILQKIKEKISLIPDEKVSTGMKAVVTHIEVAQSHLLRAREENDDQFLNDAVYRANHAFEGILRETYSIISKRNGGDPTTYEIERYLSRDNRLKERVSELFRNYRQKWRNPSTHEHDLFFSEQEAFLAIISVSAFIYILIDQIIEKISEDRALKEFKDVTHSAEIQSKDVPLINQLSKHLIRFVAEIKKQGVENYPKSQYEILGLIAGFLRASDSTLKVHSEPPSKARNILLKPDFIVENPNDEVIIEVKYYQGGYFSYEKPIPQLISYMSAFSIPNGILFIIPRNDFQDILVTEELVKDVGRILLIHPRTNKPAQK